MQFIFSEYIMKIACLHSGQCCPLLSLIPNVLALIGTNRACLRGCFALSKLGSTRGTNPVIHLVLLLLSFRRLHFDSWIGLVHAMNISLCAPTVTQSARPRVTHR